MSDNFLDAIRESKIFGVFIFQDAGNIVYANDRLSQILGFKNKEDLIGVSFFDFLINQKDEIIESALKRVQLKSVPKEYREIQIKNKSNAILTIESFVYTVNYNNKPSGLVLLIDKSKEQAYKKLYFATSQINQLIIRQDDENSLIKDICNVLVDVVGYSGCGIGSIDSTTKMFEFLYAKSKEKIDESELKHLKTSIDENFLYGKGSISKAYHSKKPSIVNNLLESKDVQYWRAFYKKYNFNSVCSIPIFKNDKCAYILVIYDLLNNAFESQEELRLINEIQLDITFAINKIESQKNMILLNEAIEKSHEWALITDENGVILYVNQAVCEISGYSKAELIGKNPRIFKSGYQDNNFYKLFWNNILIGKSFESRFINKKKNDSLFYLDSITVPLLQDGKAYRFVSLGKDVSELVRQQNKIEFQAKIYNTLYQISNFSVESKTIQDFLKKLVCIFVEYADFDVAYIAKLTEEKSLRVTYKYFKNAEYEKFLNLVDEHFTNQKNTAQSKTLFALQKTLKFKKIYIENAYKKKNIYPFDEHAKLYGFQSCSSIPILSENKLYGALVLISKNANIFDKSIYDLLKTTQKQIKFTLTKFEQEKFSQMALAALNSGFEFVIITDENFYIVYANDKALEISQYSKQELIGKHHSIFSSKQHSKEFAKEFYNSLKTNKSFSGIMKYKVKDGKVLDFYINIVPFVDNGKITNYIAVGKRIENTDALLYQLDYLLNFDSNTGLINLHSFEQALKRFLERAKYEQQIGAIAIINPIEFKNINQAFGYEKGNELLKQIGARLKQNLRDYDIVAKLESDRFGVIIKDLRKEEDIIIVTAKLLNELIKPYFIESEAVSLSFNIGLSFYPKDGTFVKELIDKAQIALMDAGQKGDNQIGFFRSDLEENALTRLKLKADLELAILNKSFKAYFQPYVDSRQNIVGAEALMRWQKDGKIVQPMEFIEQLEESNLIIDAENLMIENVLSFMQKIMEKQIKIPISVNLSSKSLFARHFSQNLKSSLYYHNITESLLGIEIVERTLMHDFSYIQNLIKELKQQKVYFSIDDFGTGYSSLAYISELDIDYLKIDISFVRKLIENKKIQSTVKSIIYLAKELNLKTIAEGVETREQFEFLKDIGCDYFQGYLFYKPVSDNEFLELLNAKR